MPNEAVDTNNGDFEFEGKFYSDKEAAIRAKTRELIESGMTGKECVAERSVHSPKTGASAQDWVLYEAYCAAVQPILDRERLESKPDLAARAAQQAQRKTVERVVVKFNAGYRAESVGIVAKLLGASGLYFNRGGQLSRLFTLPEDKKDLDGTKRAAGSIIIRPAVAAAVVSDLSRLAEVQKYDGRQKTYIDCDLPDEIAQSVIAIGVEDAHIKTLRGVVHVPILRPDGTIITTRGYDRQSQLYLAADVDWSEFDGQDEPTREDAIEAAKWLMDEIYGEFKTDAVGRSILLSSLLTAILRPYIDGSPLHCFDAPAYGAGKSLLAEVVGVVATGMKPPMSPPGETKEETMKVVQSVIRSGDAVNVLDNISQPLTGDALCVALTAEFVNIRVCGTNTMLRLQPSAFWMATGQNLTVSADMVRRSVIARIDPGIERPELSEFQKPDLIGWVREHRMEILSRLYTILRAHAQHGFPHGEGAAPRLGSFGGWARRVAGLCMWVGHGNPMKSQDVMYSDDPMRARRATLLDAIYDWQESVTAQGAEVNRAGDRNKATGTPWPVRELFEAATSDNGRQVLYDFLKNGFKAGATAHTLGNYLRTIRGQVTGGKKLINAGFDSSKTALWFVESVVESADLAAADDAGTCGD